MYVSAKTNLLRLGMMPDRLDLYFLLLAIVTS